MIRGELEDRSLCINGRMIYPDKSQKLRNHSPDGFMWGYGGSGPAQLALAILLEFLPDVKALNLYQKFKFDIIAKLHIKESFEIPEEMVEDWIKDQSK